MSAKPVVLCILDGWGLSEKREGNAPLLAKTPVMDRLTRECPTARLRTHGRDVGLPEGQMGNSEVGHTNIGAGRVVWMDLPRIDTAIEDGSFARNAEVQGFITRLKDSGGVAHVAGLVSSGGVHAHDRHILEAARVIAGAGVPVAMHVLTDGRDVAPSSALAVVRAFEAALPDGVRIATVIGRYWAMDRDKRWERVERAWRAMALADGDSADNALACIEAAYARGETDEFIAPTVIGGFGGIDPAKDGLFFANFRADRAREILQAALDPAFDGFVRGTAPIGISCGMVEYSDALAPLIPAMFPPGEIVNTLGEWVAAQGKRQFRLAETEKYPHVTFFLNGGRETPFAGEARHMPSSPKVATYDLAPEMSAAQVTEAFLGAIEDGFDLIVNNFANPDMVGHTGDLDAAMRACEAVDTALGRVCEALETAGGAMLVCADHGNCEVMIDPETGGPHTAHTTNLVPLILVGGPGGVRLEDGRLADLAPTLLALMGLEQPPEMTGRSLLI